MSSHAILPAKLPLVLLGLLLSSGFTARAASFDCQKTATVTEQAICTDNTLSAKDEAIATVYQSLMAALPQQEAIALRAEQRRWLRQRSACTGSVSAVAACLTPQFIERENALNTRLISAQQALDADIATIPGNPAGAATRLRQYADPLAQAWLLYLHEFIPGSGVSDKEAQRAESIAGSALKASDDFAWSIWQDVRNDPKSSHAEAALILLRLSIEQADYNTPQRPWVHCFIFSQPGDAVWQAFGPLYGSSRDSMAPICAPQGGLFRQEAWKQLKNQFTVPENTISATAGTVRFASFAAWRLFALRATLAPRDFLNRPSDMTSENDSAHRIRDWTDERVWPAPQRQLTLAAIEPARLATARWLQQERDFSADDAQTAAGIIVELWLKQHLDYLSENSDSE